MADAFAQAPDLSGVVGGLPYRVQLAGGWIDQPFVSRLDPDPPGSMVVVSLLPTVRYMDRCGMATGTRAVARALWGDTLPTDRDPADLVRVLYAAENEGRAEPSGSQDMCGLVLPGINRLDYDVAIDGGWFPSHIESCTDPDVAAWLESVLHLVPVAPRPAGYAPLGIKRLDPDWVERLSASGKACYDAIAGRDLDMLGESLNETMRCWEHLLPHTVAHPTIEIDLVGLLRVYQQASAGAMYSGCGGGYLLVAADHEVPGSLHVTVRSAGSQE